MASRPDRAAVDSGVRRDPPTRGHPPPSRLSFESRVLAYALLAGLPGTLLALVLLWTNDYRPKVEWTFTIFVVGFWLAYAFALREKVVRPLQTLSNLLGALLEGDYSIRSRVSQQDDALGLAMLEVNALGRTLREQRFTALEATALLRTVMEKIDVAVFAFDDQQKLRLVNAAGERLLDMPAERMRGRTAAHLGIAELLEGAEDRRTLDRAFAGGRGRWEIRRSIFRQGGLEHQLLVVSDVTKVLREEELLAWQRLIRVLSHEINNSLAPIKSIAHSLLDLIGRSPLPAEPGDDLARGLDVIAGRSEGLARFMGQYARLARLPAPRYARLDVDAWIRRVVRLETRMPVQVERGPQLTIEADGDQLDQVLINLVQNAVDSTMETGGAVRVTWTITSGDLIVRVIDDGQGLADTANLFVPFFTTKPRGSGIGLALSRQIAEQHGGAVTLANRRDARGCIAVLRLPVRAPATPPAAARA